MLPWQPRSRSITSPRARRPPPASGGWCRGRGRQGSKTCSPGSGHDVPRAVRQQSAEHHQAPESRHPHCGQSSKAEKGWSHRAASLADPAQGGPACAGIGERQTGPELEAHHVSGRSLPGRSATVPALPARARTLLAKGDTWATGLGWRQPASTSPSWLHSIGGRSACKCWPGIWRLMPGKEREKPPPSPGNPTLSVAYLFRLP